MSNHGKPAGKQLGYLRDLARQTGTTFVTPRSNREASWEIERLRQLGYGATARWKGKPRRPARNRRPGHPDASRARSRGAVSRRKPRPVGRVLAGYVNRLRVSRAVVALGAAEGTTLVADQGAGAAEDQRQIAHLGADESVTNAELLAKLHLAEATRGRCRRVTSRDFDGATVSTPEAGAPPAEAWDTPTVSADGVTFELAVVPGERTSRAVRWTRTPHDPESGSCVGLRRVAGELLSYEAASPAHERHVQSATTIMRVTQRFTDLPGGDIVEAGLADLRAGRQSESALAVTIAAPRLRRLGIDVPSQTGRPAAPPEHRLYNLLGQQPGGGAHSRYNALLARMASFASAAEHATAR